MYIMNKKQLLQSLAENVYARLGVSRIEGVGVFAIRDIPKGKNPFIGSYMGHLRGKSVGFSPKELASLHPEVKKMIADFFVEEEGKVYIPTCGLNRLDISFFVNHSVHPNLEEDTKNGGFRALQDIAAGEELTIDYHAYSGEDTKELI